MLKISSETQILLCIYLTSLSAYTGRYNPSYFEECIEHIKRELGPSDEIIKQIKSVPKLVQDIAKQTETIDSLQRMQVTLGDIVQTLRCYFYYPVEKLTKLTVACHISKDSWKFVKEFYPNLQELVIYSEQLEDGLLEESRYSL
jgi:hypothetical protein